MMDDIWISEYGREIMDRMHIRIRNRVQHLLFLQSCVLNVSSPAVE